MSAWVPKIDAYFDHELGAVEQAVFQNDAGTWEWTCGCGSFGDCATEEHADSEAEAHLRSVTGRTL